MASLSLMRNRATFQGSSLADYRLLSSEKCPGDNVSSEILLRVQQVLVDLRRNALMILDCRQNMFHKPVYASCSSKTRSPPIELANSRVPS